MPIHPQMTAFQIYDGTGVNARANWPVTRNFKWQGLVTDVGFRHTRGSLGRQKTDVQYMKPLFDAGIKHCATLVQSSGGTLDKTAAKANILAMRDLWGAQNIEALEGPNEFNKGDPANWAAIEREFVQWMHGQIRAVAELKHCLIIAPSVYRRLLDAYKALGNIDPWVDRGCLHYYTGLKVPTKSNYVIDTSLAHAALLTPKVPWVTETGYSDHLTVRIRAKYLLRLLLELLRRGVERAHIFEMFDTDPTPLWGLADGNQQPRLHYYSVKNFMALVKDGPSAPQAPIPIKLTGGTDIQRLVLTRSDGSFLVMLWRDIVSKEADAAPVNVTLELAKAAGAELHYPTFSDKPAKSFASGTSFVVPVLDHLSVLRVTP